MPHYRVDLSGIDFWGGGGEGYDGCGGERV